MAIFRGPGGSGDATTDASSQATIATLKAAEAAASAIASASSATDAATAETGAETSETNAATSASNASTSATNAGTSESNASTSASTATTKASEASASASTATTKASEASTSASNASTSESNASTSASNSATSASASAASAAAAAATKDSIDEFYLGAQSSNPTVDNNGDAVTAGDWYFNTSANETRIYNGSAWQVTAVSTAGLLTAANNLSDLASATTARTNLGLGTAATTATTAYATAAQGATADSALQNIVEDTTPQLGANLDTQSFTVDGRDVSTDGTKLDTIETNADVTDTANVTSSGALMDSEVTNLAQVKAFDTTDYVAKTSATGSAALPAGTTAQRDGSPATGYLRWNSTIGSFEGYGTSSWDSIGNLAQPRNLIINGNMNIAQRATSVTGITTATYHTIDRWRTDITTAGTWTQTQDTDVPSGQGFAVSLKMDCTTVDASLAAGDRVFLGQRLEGFNVQSLAKGTANAKSTTLSFWVKSNKTGTYIAELFDSPNARQISTSYTISVADTWEKKTITYAGDTSGVLANDNDIGLMVQFWLAAGSTYTSGTLNTSWAANTNANRAVGQVNLADSTSNYINITGVQLEVNATATPFEHLQYGQQLALCQRYFEVVITNDANGFYGTPGAGAAVGYSNYFYQTTKRAAPTIVLGAGGTLPTVQVSGQSGYSSYASAGVYPRVNTGTTISSEL